MKRSMIWKSALLSTALLTAGGYAYAAPQSQGETSSQQRPNHQRHARGDRAHGQRNPGQAMDMRLRRALFRDIKLDKDQNKQVRTIMKDAGQQRDQWRKAHENDLRQVRQDMAKAHWSGDAGALEQAYNLQKKLLASQPKPADMVKKLRGVLHDDQTQQFDKNVQDVREHFMSPEDMGPRPERRMHRPMKGPHRGGAHQENQNDQD